MDKSEAKQLVIRAGRELSRTGLIARTWGNVSCRVGVEDKACDATSNGMGDTMCDGSFVITASGRNYMTLTEQEVVEVNISDLSYQGDIKPSSEKKVHREIYKLRPEVGFIIHTHQDNASAVAAMGSGTIKLSSAYEGIGDEIIIAEYGLPGTDKLCNRVGAAVRRAKGNAIIMANHGTVCYGKNYEEAFAAAHMLERACGEYLAAKMPDKREYFSLKVTETDLNGLNNFIRDEITRSSKADMDKLQGKNLSHEGLSDQPNLPPKMQFKDGTYRLINNTKPVADISKLNITLRPYVDDFAQIVGTKVKPGRPGGKALPVELTEGGAICYGETPDDAEAVSMILTKNCMAYFAAQAAGAGKAARPISRLDCMLMRRIYLKKYSKQIKEI